MNHEQDKIDAYSVFTPNGFPRHTYVTRESRQYERLLLQYLKIGGTTVTVSGPSKSGKTILVRRVVGDGNLVVVSPSGLASPDDLWDRVLDKVRAPHAAMQQQTTSTSRTVASGTEVGGMLFSGINGLASISVELNKSTSTTKQSTAKRRGVAQVVELFANQQAVILIDDFHFIEKNLQTEIAKAIKGASHEGVRFVVTVASHRSDDLERATDQLIGRVANLDIEPWNRDELIEIPLAGFPLLNAANDILVPFRLVSEAGGSPQLMQAICLYAAIEKGFETRCDAPAALNIHDEDVPEIMRQATGLTQLKSVAEILLNGPKSRGTSRGDYTLEDGTAGDVYYCVLKAIADGDIQLSFSYEEIKARVENLVKGTAPFGSSIASALEQMSLRNRDQASGERRVDWDEDKRTFTIVDPYLLFYLRWSSFLRNAGTS